jgi:transaldolase
MSNNLETLHQHGVSVWLDDLSRELTDGGELQRLVDAGVLGVTSNPTIFATALSKGDRYTDQVKELVSKGIETEEAVFHITTEDVRRAWRGSTSRETRPSRPSVRSKTGLSTSQARRTSSVVMWKTASSVSMPLVTSSFTWSV